MIIPGDARAHNNLGYAYAKIRMGGNVRPAFCCGGATGAGPPRRHTANYAVALARAGRLTDAIAEYRQGIAAQAGRCGRVLQPGQCICADRGIFLQAITAYQSALRYRPEHPEAHNNLATVLRRLGRLEKLASTMLWRCSISARLSPGAAQPRGPWPNLRMCQRYRKSHASARARVPGMQTPQPRPAQMTAGQRRAKALHYSAKAGCVRSHGFRTGAVPYLFTGTC